MSTNSNNSKIHPDFALQMHTWLRTLGERFDWQLERITRELAENVYHAPNNVKRHVGDFISGVKQSDCIACGDVETFNRLYNQLDLALRPLKYLANERPLNHNHAQGD